MPKSRRQKDLAKIHIAKKDLRLPDQRYRQIITGIMDERGIDGRPSSANLDPDARAALLDTFRGMGWHPQESEGPQPWKGFFDVAGTPGMISQSQADFISKMAWKGELGWLPDEPHRLTGWIERQTGHQSSVPMLTKARAHKVITGLQKMTGRR
jgi:hypothetical protein